MEIFQTVKVKHSFFSDSLFLNVTLLQEFASKLAYRHYERSLQLKCWEAWHSVVESRWKQRVEKACQGKAQEICMSLTNDYETKINSVSILYLTFSTSFICLSNAVFCSIYKIP